jgi:predicted RNA methylase
MKRLLHHLRHYPSRVPSLLWKNLCYPFTATAAELRFDRSAGIDTAGVIEASELGTGVDSKGYHAMPPKIARHMIAQVAPRARDYTFVDMGSGKGRLLLLAAQNPFRKIIGVELSKPLCEIAQRNVRKAAGRLNCIAPIDIVHADARMFALPDGKCTLFLYNPFCGETADHVVSNILRSFQAAPREIIILYYSDSFPARLSAPPFVRRDLPAQPSDRLYRYRSFGLRAVMFELTPEPGFAASRDGYASGRKDSA